jgi:hypothetical protein
MGTAGLDTKRLTGLLERLKINCKLIDDDSTHDHCVLCISSIRRPRVVAYIEYENIGEEPRRVGMQIRDEQYTPKKDDYPLDSEKEIRLKGSRKEDPTKIAKWIKQEFLELEKT